MQHSVYNHSCFNTRLVACLALLLIGGGAAQAGETAAPAAYNTLQGVTVTATKTKQDPFDVAESISIMDAD